MRYINLLLFTIAVVASILTAQNNFWLGLALLILITGPLGFVTFYEAISSQHRENLEARYRTADVRFLEELRGSDQQKMHLVKLHLSVMLRIFPWANGWVTFIGSTGVPRGFAADFLRKSDNTNLASISAWSDKALWVEPGTGADYGECRELAKELTEYLLDIGVAKNSFGNLPPRWVEGVSPSHLRAAWGIPLSIHKQDDLRPVQELQSQPEEVSA